MIEDQNCALEQIAGKQALDRICGMIHNRRRRRFGIWKRDYDASRVIIALAL